MCPQKEKEPPRYTIFFKFFVLYCRIILPLEILSNSILFPILFLLYSCDILTLSIIFSFFFFFQIRFSFLLFFSRISIISQFLVRFNSFFVVLNLMCCSNLFLIFFFNGVFLVTYIYIYNIK